MRLLAKYKDDQFPKTKIDHTRKTVRAIVFNSNNQIAIHHLLKDDIFGHRDYYETPGGGVKKNERLIDALKREMSEELGVTIKDIKPIGRVMDYFNLVKQRNNIFYYLCRVDKVGEKHYDIEESTLIEKTLWLDIDSIIKLYETMDKEPIARLIKQRELPILMLVKKMMKEG